jgi:hypothetical protein
MRAVIMTIVILCLAACSERRNKIEFCAIDRGRFDKESMVVDIEHRRVRGSDTSYEFSVVDLQFAKGFLEPFPFVLPVVQLEQVPTHWEVNGYEFTMSAPATIGPDWVLIDAHATDQQGKSGFRQHSSVLYSSKSGVMALQLNGPWPLNNLFSCGTGQVRGSSF